MQTQRQIVPRLEAIIFAEVGRIGEDGKCNLQGIFDRVNTNADRFLFWAFVRVVRANSKCPVCITITAPNGQRVGSLSVPVSDTATVQNLAPVDLPIVGEGIYVFDVTYSGQSLGFGELAIMRLGH